MKNSDASYSKSLRYLIMGILFGVGAPIMWAILSAIFFGDGSKSFFVRIYEDASRSSEQISLYIYMFFGTSAVMGGLGYLVGRNSDELKEQKHETEDLNKKIVLQKELFETRFKALDNSIKSFHQISSRIQKTIDSQEVLKLCAEGLSEVLGYERVNILIADELHSTLRFAVNARTEGFDPHSAVLPFDERAGIIYKCMVEKKPFLVEDMRSYPTEYQIKPPYDTIEPLRSKSFILCPIIIKGESVGVFGVDNKHSKRPLNDSDLDTVKLFADQAASSLTRINLVKSIDTLTLELGNTFAALLKNRESHSKTVINLKGYVDSLSDNTAHIAGAAENVMTAIDDTSASVGEISVAIEQVSRNLDALSETVEKSVSAMEEINATLFTVEKNTVVSHKVSSQVKSQADRSSAIVEETIASLAEIQNSVELSYAGIKRLAENSSRIEGIVGVINDITKRTNLLALNASIIAAQAGEYGKSFGVVADEIRNLSLQTGQSTGEITGIVEEIMTESRAAASNVTLTKDLVQKGVMLGQETGESLKVILESSNQAMDMTNQIRISTEEQAKSVQMVTRSIEDVSTMTTQIFTASKEQANATRNILRAVNTIKDMTQEMAGATGRQVDDGKEIKHAVESVGKMVLGIFEDLEKRRSESVAVVKELEMMKEFSE
ncbi:GAF domain-containing protein [Geobacter pelophilus]|uniref:GAF domain-containing protein n=1 Tax=Geoanaerobacter pelophilus TaxID=60036 RepID=A0AAW4L7N6_9BACT|nr:methyl-accepting chemotaxis protein [Geoanaerobacter pelophilus]MBT0665865.1 GAF domain-containing protein [Geoanaerobacter pelophilus]